MRSWTRLLFAEGRAWIVSCDSVEEYYDRDEEIFKGVMESLR
ncbi:MAG: hypothetical protein ACNA8W_24450 [Bradymonadaceae bacterium]